MAQEDFEELTNTWKALSDIITVDADTTYYIQNRGSDMLLACEGAAEPTDSVGILVKPFGALKYKKGTDTLYVRAYTTSCFINISSEG